MVGCSADYCTNSDKKGFKMCRIPLEANRRKVWLQNINRDDWVAGNSSAICEKHFTEDMWQNKNGKRLLKPDAVPTLFHNRISVISVPQKVLIPGDPLSMVECIVEEPESSIFLLEGSNVCDPDPDQGKFTEQIKSAC